MDERLRGVKDRTWYSVNPAWLAFLRRMHGHHMAACKQPRVGRNCLVSAVLHSLVQAHNNTVCRAG